MDIQSIIQISKVVKVEDVDTFGNRCQLEVGFLASTIDKTNQQCTINIQIFERERLEEFKEEIYSQVQDFFAHIGACSQSSNLQVLTDVLPSDDGVNKLVSKMSL